MNKFIRELRRREVFRTAGLYVGISWILIEVASVILPTFDAPEWMMRAIVMVAFVGFPVMLVLAWVYNITDHGIEVQADPTDTIVAPIGGRKMDFIVIGVLSVALIVSVYLNVISGPAVVVEQEPISVLIADFDNTTGDALFTGTLEEALQIGVEGASFITTFQRATARQVANEINPGSLLDEAAARLVAVREDIRYVLAGRIEESSGRYEFAVRAVDPRNGEVIADAKARAKSKLEVLTAVGELAGDLREELGDDAIDRERMAAKETFTAASLEAAKSYTTAQDLQDLGQDSEAVTHYAKAVELDPRFGRAYSGWALSAFNLGRTDEANELWDKALMYMDTMTERERMRTLGLYYSVVTRNYPKAVESYQALVEKYPADDSAHNNLAVLHFFMLDFQAALAEGRRVLDVYPKVAIYRGNYALYAMYAGDMETAVTEARKLVDTDPGYFKAWLPIAISALSAGDIAAARQAYQSMAAIGQQGASTATLGLAGTASYSGDFELARSILTEGIEDDVASGNQYIAAAKYIAIADAYAGEGKFAEAAEAADKALGVSDEEPWIIAAAMTYLAADRPERAQAIADRLGTELQPQSRAYGLMIKGLMASQQGRHVEAIETMTQGIALADLWLLRFGLGRVYVAAGYYAEALDEFMICQNRHGEAASLFLDDLPTYRYMVPLKYWLGVAQDGLGMKTAATESFRSYLALRPNGGAFVEDATRRLP
ncbi:MAG: tetratricopeptide repeat protein [Gammaproteobacteria bacterium]|nr:tetratricopeptide repeat protein [Gammaproteobacteria bacterium]MDH4315499.1 tetratricopeptide repeat protein [Gammaproteobacteria bacterium]MDH5214635.1 tetratricopeptide repeat protein [Gammaproteobacteria bacterium]MDH5499631.1 tetratricopeptide repeat protein [Gammaproteobacteria bacterium]